MKTSIFRSEPVRRLPATVLMTIAMAVLTAGCLNSSALPVGEASGLSRKLLPFVHFEDGAVMFIGVDSRAARYVKDGTLFPVGIGLANQSPGSLTLHRESFVLQAADGTRYPLAGLEEFNRNYGRSRTDARLADSFAEAMATRFSNYNFVNRHLFPVQGSRDTVTNSFELGRRFWTHFYLYFPIPEGGIRGQQLNLLLDMPEVEETLVVSFFVE